MQVLFTSSGHNGGISTDDCYMVRRVERKVELNQLFIGVH